MDSISIPDPIAPLDGFDERREQASLRRTQRKKPTENQGQGQDVSEASTGPENTSGGLDELA
jgi:hypothetical protein